MKFDLHLFWKHENCIDIFFNPHSVYDNSKNAILIGDWYVQGIHNYWLCQDSDIIKINPENYPKWKPYTPKGGLK